MTTQFQIRIPKAKEIATIENRLIDPSELEIEGYSDVTELIDPSELEIDDIYGNNESESSELDPSELEIEDHPYSYDDEDDETDEDDEEDYDEDSDSDGSEFLDAEGHLNQKPNPF
jgi:hypothetical protein